MVDVGAKPESSASRLPRPGSDGPDTAAAVARGDAPKGDVLGTARLAGIQAAKRTAELIPLAHPLAADVRGRPRRRSMRREGVVTLTGEARTSGGPASSSRR